MGSRHSVRCRPGASQCAGVMESLAWCARWFFPAFVWSGAGGSALHRAGAPAGHAATSPRLITKVPWWAPVHCFAVASGSSHGYPTHRQRYPAACPVA